MSQRIKIIDWTPYAYENLTISTDVISRPSLPYRNDAGALFLTVQSSTINYRIDRGDPTNLLGHSVYSESYQNLWLGNLTAIKNLRLIALDAEAVVKITYYRWQ